MSDRIEKEYIGIVGVTVRPFLAFTPVVKGSVVLHVNEKLDVPDNGKGEFVHEGKV